MSSITPATPTTYPTAHDYTLAVIEATKSAAAYHAGQPAPMDDATWDATVAAIVATESAHPDWKVDHDLVGVAAGVGLGDIPHATPMLSLEKTLDPDALSRWWQRMAPTDGAAVTPKMDGAAISCIYVDGTLQRVVTRGNGEAGELVVNSDEIVDLPATLTEPVTLDIRGELYMTADQFAAANQARVAHGATLGMDRAPFVNRRNAIGGAARRDKAEPANDYPIEMSFAAYSAVQPDGTAPAETFTGTLQRIGTLGVRTVADVAADAGIGTIRAASLEDVTDLIGQIGQVRPDLPFDIDGAVIHLQAAADADRIGLHASGRAPGWAVAWKYPAEERYTTLRAVTVQVGRTGVLTPVAELEPVVVGGVTVERATLHNMAQACDVLDVHIGDRVVVKRAGDVVPRVESVDVAARTDAGDLVKWQPPTACPTCGNTDLDRSQERWRCHNPDCALLPSLVYWCGPAALDIDGVGAKLLEKLVEAGTVDSIADLYRLTAPDIASLDGEGQVSASNAIAAIEASKGAPLVRWLTGLGVPLTGRTMCGRLAETFRTLSAVRNATLTDLLAVDGIGPGKGPAIEAGLAKRADLIDQLLELGAGPADLPAVEASDAAAGPLAGKTVVVTGKVGSLSRTEAREAVQTLGGRSTSSLSARTDLLVVGDGGGSKVTKAEALGVATMPAEEFLALLPAG